jgi:hypothetical protein
MKSILFASARHLFNKTLSFKKCGVYIGFLKNLNYMCTLRGRGLRGGGHYGTDVVSVGRDPGVWGAS